MNFKLEKITELSGAKASIYSVVLEGENSSLLEQFLEENEGKFQHEVDDIYSRLYTIAHKTGGRNNFFKENEGKPGDLVCALYDDPDSNLRLYCIKFGATLIVIGGGGHKPKSIHSWQEDSILTLHAEEMIVVSDLIAKRIRNKDLNYSRDFLDFEGNLEFNDEDDE